MPTFKFYNNNLCTRLELLGRDVKDLLLNNGWLEKNDIDADYIFINTCAFLKKTEDYFIQQIRKIEKEKQIKQKIIVFGCLPQIAEKRLKTNFSGDIIKSTELKEIANYLNLNWQKELIGRPAFRQKTNFNTFSKLINRYIIKDPYLGFISGEPSYHLNICRGCLGNCSYCVETLARGRLKSKTIEDIIGAIENGLEKGFKVFSLNGDDVGAFGLDIDKDIADLLSAILNIKKDFKLILTEFNPCWLVTFKEKLLPLLLDERIAHITIPIQSGSNKILKLMQRGYNIDEVIDIIKEIKKQKSNITINTHLIAGFPQETKSDFQQTLSLINSGLFDKAKVFGYSDRPEAKSYQLNQKNSKEIIKKRIAKLKNGILKTSFKSMNLRNIIFNLPLYWK